MAVPDAGAPIGPPLGAVTGTPTGVGVAEVAALAAAVGVEAETALAVAVGVDCADGCVAVADDTTEGPAADGGAIVQCAPLPAAHPVRTRLVVRTTSILSDRGPMSTDNTSNSILRAGSACERVIQSASPDRAHAALFVGIEIDKVHR